MAADRSKSGLFAHFKSKQQLQIGLLDAAAALARRHVVMPVEGIPFGLPHLTELVNLWLGWSRRAGLSGGCPVAAALFELDDLDGPVGEHVMLLENKSRNLLRGLAEEAKAAGHFRHDVDSEQVAWELCGIYLAHHASSRFLRDEAADERAQKAVKALFERAESGLPTSNVREGISWGYGGVGVTGAITPKHHPTDRLTPSAVQYAGLQGDTDPSTSSG